MASIAITQSIILLLSITHIFGQDKYNPKKSICCNGTVIDKDGIERPLCCGNVVYDLKKNLCCGDKLLPIPEGAGSEFDYGCCRDSEGEVQLVHQKTQQCCLGVPVDKPDANSSYGCCNGRLYHAKTQFCCNATIVERQDQACCVDRVFNTSVETCCRKLDYDPAEGIIYHVFPHEGNRTKCCGQGLYDPNTESCCKEKIQPRPKDLAPGFRAACCKEEPYDPFKQRCCIKGEMKNGKHVITEHKIHNIPVKGHNTCCLLELFDPKKEVCCNATVMPKPDDLGPNEWPRCCEGQALNDKTHICHFGKPVQRKDNDFHMDLCGKQWYNRTSEKCCKGEILEPEEDCCWYSGKKFVKLDEICCRSGILKLTKDDKLNGRSHCCMPRKMFGR